MSSRELQAEREARDERGEREPRQPIARPYRRQWFGMLGGPAAAFGAEVINHEAAPWACGVKSTLTMHLVFATALAIVVWSMMSSWDRLHGTGGRWTSPGGGPIPRSRFLAAVGFMIGAWSILVVIAMWLAVLFIDPCVTT